MQQIRHCRLFLASMLVLLVFSIVAGCGCIKRSPTDNVSQDQPNAKTADAAQPKNQPTADLARWTEYFSRTLEDPQMEADEAWGLFSSGGMTGLGQGQRMIFSKSQKQTGRVRTVQPGGRDIQVDRDVTGDAWKLFKESINSADTLKDVSREGFDQYEFEYWHAVVESGKAKVIKKVMMKGLDEKETPAHNALIKAFQVISK